MIRRLLTCILSIPVVLALLTSCSMNRPTGFEQLPEKLKSQIEREQDDYLNAINDKSINELLTLHSITYGSFTESGSFEILVLFKVNGVPHAGGLDRTVSAIYDANTYKLKNQKTFAADDVSIQLLTDANQRDNILYIGSTTYQRYTTYSIELFQVEKDKWISKAVSPEIFAEDYAYAFSSNVLQVFDLSYSGHTLVYNHKYTLYWDMAEAIFKKGLPTETINHENFDYGDELNFYMNDEKSNNNPTAISVVEKYLTSKRENDYDTWLSTLTPEKQRGFSREMNGDFGVISLKILDIHYETDTGYKHSILKSKKAKEIGLTADNIAVVYVLYDVKYDNTKVPTQSGEIEWRFDLIREDNKSPWYIQGWGYGYGGI